MRVFQSRLLALAFLFVATFSGATGASDALYPNELKEFRFYAKYLAPLHPGVSDEESVRKALGDTAAVKRDGWTIIPFYETKGGPASNPTLGPLTEIDLRPDAIIPMGAIKFPASFIHCHTIVSEMNILFDVYNDRFGLEYWLHEENSQWGKKGELYQIVYGPKRAHFNSKQLC